MQDARHKATVLDMHQSYSGALEYHRPVRLELTPRHNPRARGVTNLDAIEALDVLEQAVQRGQVIGDGVVIDFIAQRQVVMTGWFSVGIRSRDV